MLKDFRSEFSAWEDEVLELFSNVDRFLATQGRANGNEAAASVVADVASLRGLVEQQTDVLAALVNALTGQAAVTDTPKEIDERTSDHSGPEADPFDRLQQAVAAASEAS